MKIELPKIQPTTNNTFILLEDYTIAGITIPKGEPTDGLTLKLFFLKIFVDKFSPKLLPFAFLHDYLCRKEKYKLADDLGEKVLFQIEDSRRTRFGMWAIRAYHKIKYRT